MIYESTNEIALLVRDIELNNENDEIASVESAERLMRTQVNRAISLATAVSGKNSKPKVAK